MPIVDNRPSGDAGGGGPIDIVAVKDAVKADWKTNVITVAGADIANGYITLPVAPQDQKVIFTVLGGGELEKDVDYTVSVPLQRITFSVDLIAKITEIFNKYGTVHTNVAYYAVS